MPYKVNGSRRHKIPQVRDRVIHRLAALCNTLIATPAKRLRLKILMVAYELAYFSCKYIISYMIVAKWITKSIYI